MQQTRFTQEYPVGDLPRRRNGQDILTEAYLTTSCLVEVLARAAVTTRFRYRLAAGFAGSTTIAITRKLP